MDSHPLHNLWVLGQKVKVVGAMEHYAMVDIVAPPSMPDPLMHLHRDCSEAFYVLEGELELVTEKNRLRLRPGRASSCRRGCCTRSTTRPMRRRA